LIDNKDKVCEKIKMNVNFQVVKTKVKKKGSKQNQKDKEKDKYIDKGDNDNNRNNYREINSLHTIITTNRSGLNDKITPPVMVVDSNNLNKFDKDIMSIEKNSNKNIFNKKNDVHNYDNENIDIDDIDNDDNHFDYDYNESNSNNEEQNSYYSENFNQSSNIIQAKEKENSKNHNYNCTGMENERNNNPEIYKNRIHSRDKELKIDKQNEFSENNFSPGIYETNTKNNNFNTNNYPQSLDLCMQLLNESLQKSNEVLSKTILTKPLKEDKNYDVSNKVVFNTNNSNNINHNRQLLNNDFEKYKSYLN
jgi:hypothetical protein